MTEQGKEKPMDDLISRQDAITAYCEHECGKGMMREKCGAVDCGTIFDDIPSAQPEVIACGDGELKSVDTVEVVRCKDCKWYVAQKRKCKLDEILIAENDYCSYGERR